MGVLIMCFLSLIGVRVFGRNREPHQPIGYCIASNGISLEAEHLRSRMSGNPYAHYDNQGVPGGASAAAQPAPAGKGIV